MEQKIIIGAIAVALFAYAGRWAALRLVHTADRLRLLQEDIKKLKYRTREKRLNANEALLTLEGEAFSRMLTIMKEDESMTLSKAWEKSGGAGEDLPEENALVTMLFDSLESLGRQEQEKEYERALNDLKAIEEKRRREGQEKMKLYTSLGALTGLCAVIFLA
ncbi:MAG: hypothetical protein IKJ65_01415 [Clostridia bacterium]|nr:hypothetical protein [Clostridia bacterium]